MSTFSKNISAVADDRALMVSLRFKGGTCAAMRNLLDRFSVDLDFDLLSKEEIPMARGRLETIFAKLHLTINDQSKTVPQYFLRYAALEGQRTSIALDVTVPPPQSNTYEVIRFIDNDAIVATGGPQIIDGRGGNDSIVTGNFNDIICGGTGDDRISSGGGNDIVFGGDGNDSIDGGAGNDILLGNQGNDTINGNTGFDVCFDAQGEQYV